MNGVPLSEVIAAAGGRSQPQSQPQLETHEENNSSELGVGSEAEITQSSRMANNNMTVKGSGSGANAPPASDADRRAIMNRSRTDTMYMRDFDLSEFASAAGDAMALVNAENQSVETSPHPDPETEREDDDNMETDPASTRDEVEDHLDGSGYEEVERVDEDTVLEEGLEEEEEEEENQELELDVSEGDHSVDAAAAIPLPVDGHSPQPTPESKDTTLPAPPAEHEQEPAAPVESAAEHAAPTEAPPPPTPVVEPEASLKEDHKEPEEPIGHPAPGEVRAVSAHLGLESEADDAHVEEEVSWADSVPKSEDEE